MRRCDDADVVGRVGNHWSWDVVEAVTNRIVANCYTRIEARREAAERNRVAGATDR